MRSRVYVVELRRADTLGAAFELIDKRYFYSMSNARKVADNWASNGVLFSASVYELMIED